MAARSARFGAILVLVCLCLVGFLLLAHAQGTPEPCGPGDKVKYDVAFSNTPYGDVMIEECVTRFIDSLGVVTDRYTYTVTNLSFVDPGDPGCGLCAFEVPTAGATPTGRGNDQGWQDVLYPDWWLWLAAPPGEPGCPGLAVGQSGTFWVEVHGPTTDCSEAGLVGACTTDNKPDGNGRIDGSVVKTTGPCGPAQEPIPCPKDHIFYDTSIQEVVPGEYIQIEECVTRDGMTDTYTYTVTNQSHFALCSFHLQNLIGGAPSSWSSPNGWNYATTPSELTWSCLPVTQYGIAQNGVRQFSISVLNTTYVEMPLTANLHLCDSPPESLSVETTGPGKASSPVIGCPDLKVDISTGAPGLLPPEVAQGGSYFIVAPRAWYIECRPATPGGTPLGPVVGLAPIVKDADAVARGWANPAQVGASCCSACMADTCAAHWVGTAQVLADAGNYCYELRFCLCETFTTARIEGCLLADNSACVELNGVPVLDSSGQPLCTPTTTTAFMSSTPVDITSGFQPGWNTLTVIVKNSALGTTTGSWTGMLFAGWLTANGGACTGSTDPLD